MTLTQPRLDKAHIKKLAREFAPSYQLYYPGRKWFKHEFNGNLYCFPPDLGGRLVEHPALRLEKKNADGTKTFEPVMVQANGILEIKDRYGVVYGKKAVPLYHPEYGYAMGYGLPIEDPEGKLEDETADKVVQYFTNKFGFEVDNPTMALGITLLTGNPELDESVKVESRKVYFRAQITWAEEERAKRLKDVAEWKINNPGRTDIPPMNTRQIEAEEILLQAEEDRKMSTFQYVCFCGAYETDDKGRFDRHMKIRHPERLAPPTEEEGEWVDGSEPEEEAIFVPKKRGRPKGSKNLPKAEAV